jgi:hypothetical protein
MIDETAEALTMSPSKVKREWAMARAWLWEFIDDGAGDQDSVRAEADEADQRPVGVVEKPLAHPVKRVCGVQVQHTREFRHCQSHHLARS